MAEIQRQSYRRTVYKIAQMLALLSVASDTSPVGMLLRRLSEGERTTIRRQLGEAFAGFATDGGYRLPGLSLNAVAS